MYKYIVLVVALFIPSLSFAELGFWIMSGNPTHFPTADAACQVYLRACNGRMGPALVSASYAYPNCSVSASPCDPGQFSGDMILNGPTLMCINGAFKVNNTSCRCVAPKGEYDGICQLCPAGQVVNSSTGKCQEPCPLSGTHQSSLVSGALEPLGPYCSDGCEILGSLVVTPDQTPNRWYHEFSYTGQMCGGHDMPPTVPSVPPGCPAGQEIFQGQCVAKCGTNEERGSNGQCLPKCPAGYGLLNGKCIPSFCPAGQHLEGGKCVDNPDNPNCGSGEVQDVNGQCVPGCPKGSALVNGECKTPSCPSGQTYSGTLQRCVSDDKTCKIGETKDENGNCVPLNNNNCPEDSYWLGACKRCVKSGEPIPQCNALQNGSDGDLDGDGTPNNSDPDMDGDGTPNNSDSDRDGDGIPNNQDSSPDGPGSTNSGPGTNDIDGDGIPNDKDSDIDGDGIPNSKDGTPNGTGDGAGGDKDKPVCDPAVEQCDPTKAGTPAGGPGMMWESKGVKFSEVWDSFVKSVRSAPIFQAGGAFFSVHISSGRCPVWTLKASRFWSDITIDFQCSSDFIDAFKMLSVVVLLSAAWIAFYIAFL